MKFNDDRWDSQYSKDTDDKDERSVIPYEECDDEQRSNGKGRIFFVFACVLLLTAVLIAALCFASASIGKRNSIDDPVLDADIEDSQSEWQGVFASRDISERCLSTCVSIRLGAVGDYGAPSATGIVVSPDGWILTGENILGSSQIGRYYAKFYDGSEYAVEKVKKLREYGLLLMKIDAKELNAVQISDDNEIYAGQSAAAISSLGAPYHELAIRQCILSGFSEAAFDSSKTKLLRTDIEFDGIAVGSPVFDRDGRVLGIALYENQKFILPIDEIRDKIEIIQ